MTKQFDFDVAIIGGGPAGAAAALTLAKRPDIRTVVIDSSKEGTLKTGESLSPGVRSLLKYLDVWNEFESSQTLSLWGNEASWGSEQLCSMDFMNTLHGAGWSLNRRAFDDLLLSQVPKEQTVKSHTKVTELCRDKFGWTLELLEPDGVKSNLKAQFIIDASGRSSKWPLRFGHVRKRYDNLIGLTQWLQVDTDYERPLVTQVEACSYGWWYSALVPGERLVVSLMTDASIIRSKKLNQQDAWLKALKETTHIGNTVKLRGSVVGNPKPFAAFSSRLLPSKEDIPFVATGDCAASHDPLSSSGIPHALGTGIQAARVAADFILSEGILSKVYYESIEADFNHYLNTKWKTYCLENRWINEPFWRFRRAQSSLNPEAYCEAKKTSNPSSIFVSHKTARDIVRLASERKLAHHIVSDIRQISPELTDERIILAVEDLCLQPM